MKINKREREYITPAVLYRWSIYVSKRTGRGRWDDDHTMPVKVGSMCDNLIAKGVLESYDFGCDTLIRKTKLASKFICRSCCEGKLYDENSEFKGLCPSCDGTGLKLEING